MIVKISKYSIWLNIIIFISACNYSTKSVLYTEEFKDTTLIINELPTTISLPSQTHTTYLFATVSQTLSPSLTKSNTITSSPVPMPNIRLVYCTEESFMSFKAPDEIRILLDTGGDPGNRYNPEYMYLSRNGTKIIFMGENWPQTSVGIDVIDFTGGYIHTLLTPEQIAHLEQFSDPYYGLGLWNFRWLPNSPNLLFTTGAYYVQNVGSTDNLFSLNVETGILKRIYKKGDGGYAEPSPNGKLITISKSGSLTLATTGGKVIYKDIISYTNSPLERFIPNIVWMADSSKFGTFLKSSIGAFIYTVDVTSGETLEIAVLDKNIEGILSPLLNFFADTRVGSESFPHIVEIEGNAVVKVLKMGKSHFISFSPNGQYFAFTTNDNKSLYIGSITGDIITVSEITSPKLFHWINNQQFVYQNNKSIQLGDIGGNTKVIIASETSIYNFDVVDLDFVQV